MIQVTKALKEPVDLEFLRNITDYDAEFEKDLLKIFIESSNNDIGKMEESLGDTKSNNWYLSSHSFKGSAASIGAFSLAKSLEYAQFHKDDLDEDKMKTLTEIKNKLDIVVKFLTKEFLGV
jgi:HPt (histidine-containing phosphotransfer) domain-containing protein